jgi:hypothetical protein
MRRRWLLAIIVALLYLATWVGGWITHARQWKAQEQALWERGEQRVREKEEMALKLGGPAVAAEVKEYNKMTHWPDGPKGGVNWCVPLLPGVLLSSTELSVGPLAGCGDLNLVVYYGFGAAIVGSMRTWLA